MLQKTIGPFNGTQLTVIIVTVLAFMLPTSLWAVDAYQNVAIQDPVAGHKAIVDSARRLSVSDGPALMDENPVNFVRFSNLSSLIGCIKVAAPPVGRALVIKTLNLNIWDADASGPDHFVAFRIGSACSGGVIHNVNPGGVGPISTNFEPGLVIPAGQFLWRELGSSELNIEIFGTGYLVGSSWALATPPSLIPVSASAASQSSQQSQ